MSTPTPQKEHGLVRKLGIIGLGGTQTGGEHALSDSWVNALDFLRANLER